MSQYNKILRQLQTRLQSLEVTVLSTLESLEDRPELEECSICLEPLNNGSGIKKLECKHQFHRACIETYMRVNQNARCPLCRYPRMTSYSGGEPLPFHDEPDEPPPLRRRRTEILDPVNDEPPPLRRRQTEIFDPVSDEPISHYN